MLTLKFHKSEDQLSNERDKLMAQLKSAKRLVNLKQYNEALMLLEEIFIKRKILGAEEQKDLLIYYAFILEDKKLTNQALSLLKKGQRELGDDYRIIEAKVIILLRNCSLDIIYSFDEDNAYEHRLSSIRKRYKKGFWNGLLFYSKVIISQGTFEKDIILRKATNMLMKIVEKDTPKKIDFIYYLGVCLYLQRMVCESIECFDSVLDINPGYENYYVNLAFFEMVKDRRPINEEPEKVEIGVQSPEVDKVADKHSRSAENMSKSPAKDAFIDKKFHSEYLKYKTKRGIFVRSKIEALIDNSYFALGINAEYEPELNLEGEIVHPDWRLETKDGFILHEHIGSIESRKRMNYKKQVYRSNGIRYFCTFENDEIDIESAIMSRLNGIGYTFGK